MTTYAATPTDIVLEAPVSVGMLAVWAGENHDADMSQVVARALDAARQAGIQRLQDEGGWAVLDGSRFEPADLDVQPYRHYLAGDAVDASRPHEHLYVAAYTSTGAPVHRAMLPTAALAAQNAYSRAMFLAFDADGIDVVQRTQTPAGWELALVAADAAAVPRCVCPSAIQGAQQIRPLDRWSTPRAA